MQAVEADAKERATRRQERIKLADQLKERGNKEFRDGNFEAALDLYTQVKIICSGLFRMLKVCDIILHFK